MGKATPKNTKATAKVKKANASQAKHDAPGNNNKFEKWSKHSEDGEKLKQLMQAGEIVPSMGAAVVRRMYPQFMKYKGDNFRGAFKRIADETQFFLRQPQENGKCLHLFVSTMTFIN